MKRNHNPGTKSVTCNKCGATAHGTPGKVHRRCSGQLEQPIRAKHNGLPEAANRGRWE